MIIYAPFLSSVDYLRTMLTFNLQKKWEIILFSFSDIKLVYVTSERIHQWNSFPCIINNISLIF